ncbi:MULTISPECIES: ShlB/FhaC/HecB family hemolysin secretion/activation protein [Moorena]|uniref:Hemolysin activation/secretion protein n=1 Tax=Moorena producens 3L TaxID=489825 RepID=F4Y0A7_9CYAN|nr:MULTISPECIES: ShlB/FhaC/HecB family hemolysin secretion/activation protein [Moorena]EGJ29697.1 hemolysin activation/secretion protein [Moorena producens 3L]NEP68172.1 ShlB/FhaC/HecB family hemolysin secretion/activation protein [Moorena sp. SIO3A5]NEQ10187.1 ShlB/FhaC/HecB family hemolysin secretion/activation protein [Moorena sp. SIO4E2]NER91756.1 ShlB/FhaC/HecB family hemolysin secretion/activation protein [Moorena sp. SIO3A2]OLT65229.1 hemolysin activation/secretion protein [Moorena prod
MFRFVAVVKSSSLLTLGVLAVVSNLILKPLEAGAVVNDQSLVFVKDSLPQEPVPIPEKLNKGDNQVLGSDTVTNFNAMGINQLPSPPAPAKISQALPPNLPPGIELPEDRLPERPPSLEPAPEPQPPQKLPPVDELLDPSTPSPDLPDEILEDIPRRIVIKRFNIIGSTVFSQEKLAEITDPFLNQPISLPRLFKLRSEITKLYDQEGYVNSGAYIPPQELEDGVVTVEIIEGELEDIIVKGLSRLNPNYIKSRLAIATKKPLNVRRLLNGLQMLRLDPLIANISAELSAGVEPGESLLEVTVTEADTFSTQIVIDNGRSPSVGSFRRRPQIREGNLLGLGDALEFNYTNTDGSDTFDVSYTLPINPRNGTLRLAYGTTASEVIEPPFDRIDIDSESRFYEITLRQPVFQTPTEEVAIGITGSRQESETSILNRPFALSAGADDEGRTRINAIRLFQEWTKRSEQQVLAARSQLSIGISSGDTTINRGGPDSNFFAWRGQGQWVRLLAPNTILLIRGDVQLADRGLVPLEQIGIGGLQSVRGYRQDLILSDNGAFISAELRLPIIQNPDSGTLVQLTPFLDFGTGWNRDDDIDDNTIASLGLGLRWQQGDLLEANIGWGLQLVDVETRDRTLQEDGFYFSVIFRPF